MSVPQWKMEMARKYLEVGDRLKDSLPYFNKLAKENGLAGTTVNHFYHNMKKRGVPNTIKEAMGIKKESKEKQEPTKIAAKPAQTQHGGRKAATAEEMPPWKLQLCKDILLDARPLSVLKYAQRVATVFEVNVLTVKSTYYKLLKEGVPEQISKAILQDEKKEEPQLRQLEVLPKHEKPATPLHPSFLYKNASLVQVKVTSIQAMFAMVETTDKYKVVGLIHISNIRNQFIKDINDWFKIGQVLVMRVIEFNELENRLQLSTKTIPLKPHVKKTDPVPEVKVTFQEQLAQIKPMIEPQPDIAKQVFFLSKTDGTLVPTTTTTTYINTTENVPTTNTTLNYTQLPAKEVDPMENEWKQAKPFIEGIVGTVTQAAEEKFKVIMKQHGVFAFTIALMDQKDKVKADLGLMLANQVSVTIGKKELL